MGRGFLCVCWGIFVRQVLVERLESSLACRYLLSRVGGLEAEHDTLTGAHISYVEGTDSAGGCVREGEAGSCTLESKKLRLEKLENAGAWVAYCLLCSWLCFLLFLSVK